MNHDPGLRALRAGDLVGLAAPSGSAKEADQAERGAALLEGLGFRVRIAEGCRERYGYLAGADTRRASDLEGFFLDPEIRGIVCLKGGYGAPRILDLLDYSIPARNPKPFVGYSDITGLHLALHRYAGFPTFHGPMAVSLLDGLDDFSRESWLLALGSREPLGILPMPAGTEGGVLHSPRTVRGGRAEGILMGGNLSLVAALTGTPYALDPRGKILFLEDIGEEPYRVDRMLTQLRLAGYFESCAGVVLGDWKDCGAKEPDRSLTLEQIFQDVAASSGKPILAGFPAGHCVPTLTFPLGVRARLDADAGTLEILEAAAG